MQVPDGVDGLHCEVGGLADARYLFRALPPIPKILHVGLLNPDHWEIFSMQSWWSFNFFSLGISSHSIFIVFSRLAKITLPQAGMSKFDLPMERFGPKTPFHSETLAQARELWVLR